MPGPGRPFEPGQPSANPGGRSREQRSAARQQAAHIQKLTGNGKLTAEFAFAVLIAGGEPEADNPDDLEIMQKLVDRTARRFRIVPGEVTIRDRQWAAQYLDDRGLGKPVVDIDITSDGQAVGTVSLIPVKLDRLTDDQLEAVDRQIAEALPPDDGGDGDG
jgi:hypothetical protein